MGGAVTLLDKIVGARGDIAGAILIANSKWTNVNLGDIDLGSGYGYYAWRIGARGYSKTTDGTTNYNDLFSFKNISATPAEPIQLVITPNPGTPGNYDFSWNSKPGKVYDLVSSTDLSTAPDSWVVWDSRSDLPAAPPSISNLLAYAAEARQAIVTLRSGLIMEVIEVPAMDQDAMGFHFFNLFDPADEADRHGRLVGYTIYSVRFASGRGNEAVAFNKAESVGIAFDIFAPYRSNRHPALRFCRHEVYNVSRSIFFRRFRPAVFTVDARTQIRESRTGEPVKRAGYYLKRGYFPPDCKPLADQYLAEVILRGKCLTPRQAGRLHRESNAVESIHPVQPAPVEGPG